MGIKMAPQIEEKIAKLCNEGISDSLPEMKFNIKINL